MNFGEILKNLLRDTGKTQQELALFIGYSQRAVSKWINNQSEPTERAIVDCSRFFGVTTDYLLGLEDDVGGNFTKKSAPGITAEEQELLRNYRALSEPGKKLVKTTIKTFLDNSIDEGISQRRKNQSEK